MKSVKKVLMEHKLLILVLASQTNLQISMSYVSSTLNMGGTKPKNEQLRAQQPNPHSTKQVFVM